MQIKRFEAKTMTAALKMAKDEFGPEAVILSARTLQRHRGLFGAVRSAGVELTAAIDYEYPTSRAGDRSTAGSRGAPSSVPAAAVAPVRRGLLHSLNESLRSFAGRRGREADARSGDLAELLNHWASQAVAPDIAAEFGAHLKRLPGYHPQVGWEGLRSLAATALHDMGLRRWVEPNDDDGRRLLAVVGPSGVGKTTLAVKIAAMEAWQRKRRVALLTLDEHRVGAIEQMRIYAEILGVAGGAARTPSEAQQFLRAHASMERIIIDTPGVNPGEIERRTDVQDILYAVKCREVHLVLNAGLRECDLMPAITDWEKAPVSGLSFTRLDETRLYGGILNTAIRRRLPLSYLSSGPRIPEDMTDQPLDGLLDRLWPHPRASENRSTVCPSPGRVPQAAVPEGMGAAEAPAALVANRNSDLYHRRDCKWARRIKREHLLQFVSAAEAESRHFRACRSCCPDALAPTGDDALFRETSPRRTSYR